MTQKSRICAVIPARGGSKGILRKNIRPFCGKPLVAYSIIEAKKSSFIDDVYVSTEDNEIASVARDYGALTIKRPEELATDTSSTFSVLFHAAKLLNFPDVLVTLQPTSPLRKAKHIDEALACLDNNVETVVSVCASHRYMWKGEGAYAIPLFEKRLRRQEMDEQLFENGSIYVSRSSVFRRNDSTLGMGITSIGTVKLYLMSEAHSVELDSMLDFRILEELYQEMHEGYDAS